VPAIRRLTPDDAEAYVALRVEMIAVEPFAFLGVPGDDHASDPAVVRERLKDAEQAVFGAFDGGALVAVAGLYRHPRRKRRHRAEIWGVYTTPGARGRGLSRSLINECLSAARAWDGVAVVGLSACVRSASAIALYESMGFVRWGEEPDATRVDGESLAEVYLQFTL